MAVREALGGELVWYSEIEPAAIRVLQHHHPDVPNLGDITAVDWDTVEPVDILAGGFPCQDVSAAGRQRGIRPGTRSGLWTQFAYAIEKLRPRLVVIENVRGLLTARGAAPTDELITAWEARDKAKRVLSLIESKLRRARREGKTEHVHRYLRDRVRFVGRVRQAVAAAKRADARIVRAIGAVLGDLADLGYDAQWCGVRASDAGAPHARFRVFIIAWPRDAGPDAAGIGRGPEGWNNGVRAPGLVEGTAADPGRGELQEWGVGGVLAGPEGTGDGEGPQRQRDRDTVGDGGPADADTEGVRRGEGRPEPARLVGGSDASVGGNATARHAAGGRRDAAQPPQRSRESAGTAGGPGVVAPDSKSAGWEGQGPEPEGGGPERGSRPLVADPDGGGFGSHESDDAAWESDIAWGDYEPAIRRWESVLGRPAPAPTMTGRRGGQQLNPVFVEWMMGLPPGHVTDVPGLSRNEMLKMLGNGVVPQQCVMALRWMLGERATVGWAA